MYVLVGTHGNHLLKRLLQRESAHLRFRWNRSTARTGLLGFIVVPGLMYYIASKTDVSVPFRCSYSRLNSLQGRWDWNGKLKGEPLARNP